jgi:TolA-binding protein
MPLLHKARLLSIVIALTGLFGCADNQAREQIIDTNNKLSQLQDTVTAINVRLARESAIGTINQLNNLQGQIDQINGQMATLNANQQNYVTTQKQIFDSLQQQIQNISLQQESSTLHNNTSDEDSDSNADVESNAMVQNSNNQQDVSSINVASKLAKSVNNLKNHKLKIAIGELKTIIASSHDNAILEKANYYLTLGYFANNQPKEGILTGRNFVRNYPKNKHSPDVLLIIYNTQKQLGLNKEAKFTKRLLFGHYPNSQVTQHLKHNN